MSVRTALALLFAFSAVAVSGQEPPDYIGLSEKADRLAVAVTSSKTCVHFGYPDPQQALATKAQQLVDDAELSGMPGSAANTIVVGAVEAEKQRQNARVKDLESRKADPTAMDGFMDYWERRCRSLAEDPLYGPLFRR